MDLISEKQQFSDFYLEIRKNEHKNCTEKFCDVRESSQNNFGTEPLRFDSSTNDRTYEAPFAVARQSHSTVCNKYFSNSLV